VLNLKASARGWLAGLQADRAFLSLLLLVAFVGVLAYANSFTVPFVFDDGSNIVHNRGVHLETLDGYYWQRLGESIRKQGRALAQLSFALNYYFGRLDTFGYHLFNLVVHLLTTALVFLLVRLTLSLPSLGGRYSRWATQVAVGTSLIFVVHPANTQAVTYIVQRATSMATLFSLATLYFYARGRLSPKGERGRLYLASGVAFALALASKQNTVTLPVVVLLYEFCFFQQADWAWLRRYWWLVAGMVLVPLLAGLVYTKFDLLGWLSREYARRDFTMYQRVLTELRVVVYYLSLLILPFPSRLNLDYDFPLSRSFVDPPSTLAALFLILGLLALAGYIIRREPVISFFIFWYFINLAVESTILALDLVYDHRLYMPGIGPLVIMVYGAVRLVERVVASEERRMAAKAGGLMVVVLLLCGMTYKRNGVWQSVISILEDVVKKAPTNARQHVNLGVAYSDAGRLDDAIREYKRGIELDPGYPEAYNNLANAYNRKGMYQEAVKEYLKAIKMKPDYKEAHNNLGSAYCNMGLYEKAVQEHKIALKINPECEKSHNNLGVAYSFMGRYREAIEEYKKALRIRPDFLKARSNLGLAYSLLGEYDKAIREYLKVLQVKPYDVATNYNLGNVYNEKGEYRKAIEAFERVVRQRPRYAEAHNNLGLAYKNIGNLQRAELAFKRAIRLKPQIAEFYFNLGLVYQESGRLDQAEKTFREALRRKPNLVAAHFNLAQVLEVQGRWDEAVASYQEALKYAPDFAEAHKKLGLLLNRLGRPKEAAEHLNQALKLQPNQPGAEKLRRLGEKLGG